MGNLGFLASLGAALAWGSYTVPFKKSKSGNFIQFQTLMGAGILVSGLILSWRLGYSLNLNPYGLFSGILWAAANAISLVAISNLGLSRAVPLMGSLVAVGSFLWGVLVFREIQSGLVMGFIAIGLIILGVILVSATTKATSQNIKKGIAAAILAGVIWGSQLAPLKIGGLTTQVSFFPICLGIFATAVTIALVAGIKFSQQALTLSILSGVIWNIGNLFSLMAIAAVGLSKAMPIAQSSALVAVLWGLFYFKEIPGARKRMQVLTGAIILLAGVIMLGLA